DARDRRRVDGHLCGSQILTQQALYHQATERVADDDGLCLELADDLGVVLDHVVDAVFGDPLRVLPGLLDGVLITGPAGRGRLVAGLPEPFDPRAPRVGVEPQTVDEDDGRTC